MPYVWCDEREVIAYLTLVAPEEETAVLFLPGWLFFSSVALDVDDEI